MNREDFMKLVEKHRQGTASESEARTVEKFYDKMQSHTEDENLKALLTQEKGQQLFSSILSKLPNKKKTTTVQLFYKVAAAVALVLAMGITLKHIVDNPKKTTVSTAMGEQKEVLLPDGSSVTLSGNSHLSYTDTFEKERALTLEGRAYFSVKRDEKKPFSVHTRDTEIVVLGTSFDIDANALTATTVSVITGKVQVSSSGQPDNKVILTQNQQVTSSNSYLSAITVFKNQGPIAWAKLIELKNTSLGETAGILEERYGVNLKFESEDLKALRISGKFKNETLDNILKSISLVKSLSFEYQDPTSIYIKKRL